MKNTIVLATNNFYDIMYPMKEFNFYSIEILLENINQTYLTMYDQC